MDLANYYAYQTKRVPFEYFQKAHFVFYKNYKDFIEKPIDFDLFLLSMNRDKKNNEKLCHVHFTSGEWNDSKAGS